MKRTLTLLIGLMMAFTVVSSAVAAESNSSSLSIEPKYTGLFHFNDPLNTFHEGLAWVQLSRNGEIGVIDREGNLLFDGFELSPYSFTVYMFSEGLSRIEHNGKWSYVDRTGEIVLTTDYDLVLNFREGLAAVQKNGKWGYINKSGKEVIKPQFEDIRDDDGYGLHSGTSGFYEGLSAVRKNGKWGYIDKTGKFAIQPKYAWAKNFNEGLASVTINGTKWGYIDKSGKQVVKMVYDDALNYSEGLASVLRINNVGAGYHWNFIDKNGKTVVDLKNKYFMVYPFSEGVSVASYRKDSPEDIFVLLDRKGKEIVNLGKKYTEVKPFSEGLAIARGQAGDAEVLIDKTGKVAVDNNYDSVYAPSQGLIGYETSDGKAGFIRNPLDTPSNWALDEVNAASRLKLVPSDIDFGYTDNITRADFSKLAVQLLTVKMNKTLDELMSDEAKQIQQNVYKDTYDPTVLAANALGIIKGTGTTQLTPDGSITRQEAAVMITRVAEMLEIQSKQGSLHFADNHNIADWAKSSAASINSIADQTSNSPVMGSVGNNLFGPKQTFTKQQAIIAMKRLYNAK